MKNKSNYCKGGIGKSVILFVHLGLHIRHYYLPQIGFIRLYIGYTEVRIVTPVLQRNHIYEHTALTYMNKKVVFLVIMLMFTVSLSGCLGRGGGNGNGDKNMGSPEEVKANLHIHYCFIRPLVVVPLVVVDYNVLYIGHSFGRVFAETLQDYAHTTGFTDHTCSTSK